MRWQVAIICSGFVLLGSLFPVATRASDCLYNVEWAPCWGGFRYAHIPSAQPVIVPVSVPVPAYRPVYVPRISPAVYAPSPYTYSFSSWSPYRSARPWYDYGYGAGYPYRCFSCGSWGYGYGGFSYVSPSFGFSIGF